VTRCLPTVITGDPHDMLACLRNLRHAKSRCRGDAPSPVFTWKVRISRPRMDRAVRIRRAGSGRPILTSFCAGRMRRRVTFDSSRCRPIGRRRRIILPRSCRLGLRCPSAIPELRRRRSRLRWRPVQRCRRTSATPRMRGYESILITSGISWRDRLSASFIVDGIHLGRAFLRTALRAKRWSERCW